MWWSRPLIKKWLIIPPLHFPFDELFQNKKKISKRNSKLILNVQSVSWIYINKVR
jgi:hypothetical protein